MDLFQVALFVSVIVGIALIIFASFIFNSENDRDNKESMGDLNSAKSYKTPSDSLDEIDKALDELGAASRAVFAEMDEKYQELLFLYSLIDDKMSGVAGLFKDDVNIGGKITKFNASKVKSNIIPASKPIDSPRQKDILRMQNQGMAVSDIAKKLGMGQGEVKLILELGKLR